MKDETVNAVLGLIGFTLVIVGVFRLSITAGFITLGAILFLSAKANN
jgi:hypothetical protein